MQAGPVPVISTSLLLSGGRGAWRLERACRTHALRLDACSTAKPMMTVQTPRCA